MATPSSDGIVRDAVPRVSKADIEVSHTAYLYFYLNNTGYELLPESGKVAALRVNLPVNQTFHIVYEQQHPVSDEAIAKQIRQGCAQPRVKDYELLASNKSKKDFVWEQSEEMLPSFQVLTEIHECQQTYANTLNSMFTTSVRIWPLFLLG